jgi:glycosyltransferase involved in cell wall biosynthesis
MTSTAENDGGRSIVDHVGFVVIGRNEGTRLTAALESLGSHVLRAVYVDSGSTDGSVAAARERGATVVELATDVPFTAARARNAGVEALLSAYPALTMIQFLDGDCSLADGWVETAYDFLWARVDFAIVCGRRRERFPDRSIYNAMCDFEWNGPVGPIVECGGDFMIRVDAFRGVGGFNPHLIAGEEPELCLRLREKNWSIWRLDQEMTLHDANITRLGQWWRRQMRAGHAFAEVSWLHQLSKRRIWNRQFQRAMFWGAAVPLAILLLSIIVDWRFLALLAVYPLNVLRIAMRDHGKSNLRWSTAAYSVLAKFPEAIGGLKFHLRRWTGHRQALIEYK